MKKQIALMLALVLILACPAARAEEDETGRILARMSLRDKVGQMMMPAFRIWKERPGEDGAETPSVNITELNEEIRGSIRRNRFGGILLYAENCRDAEQTLRLTAEMQEENRRGGGLPMLIAVDQEGGSVSRLGFGTVGVGNMALAATGNPGEARAMARIHGEELGLLGIQVNFAPVMDVNNNPNNPVIGNRSFSDDPVLAGEYGCAYLEGLHDTGTIAALKHFPGHGNTDTDSHTGFPCIQSTLEELKACELIPFQAAIEAGADMIMTAHIQYPQIETETRASLSTGEQVCLPATMSRAVLTDLLRGEMGFEGVLVSDALDMAAIVDHFSTEDVLKYAVNAGVDLLLMPPVKNAEDFEKLEASVETAVSLAESGEISAERIDESVRRILELKKKYGLLERDDFTVTEETVQAAVRGVGSAEHRDAAWRIAEKALTLVRNEDGAFPLRLQPGDSTLILFADSCASRLGTGEMAWQTAIGKDLMPEGARCTILAHTRENTGECLQAALEADHVILVHRVYATACMNPETEDGFSSGAFDQILDALHQRGRQEVVVSCQLPYDAARFPDTDAVLLAYCSSPMRVVPPDTGEGSGYAPNLAAALCACFGSVPAEGVLPVNIPVLDDAYAPAEAILYFRGQKEAQ